MNDFALPDVESRRADRQTFAPKQGGEAEAIREGLIDSVEGSLLKAGAADLFFSYVDRPLRAPMASYRGETGAVQFAVEPAAGVLEVRLTTVRRIPLGSPEIESLITGEAVKLARTEQDLLNSLK
jgi:hypothetical protein